MKIQPHKHGTSKIKDIIRLVCVSSGSHSVALVVFEMYADTRGFITATDWCSDHYFWPVWVIDVTQRWRKSHQARMNGQHCKTSCILKTKLNLACFHKQNYRFVNRKRQHIRNAQILQNTLSPTASQKAHTMVYGLHIYSLHLESYISFSQVYLSFWRLWSCALLSRLPSSSSCRGH